MSENLLEAKEELKRLEHIIYVSLKYTRTVDVIINALNRLIGTYDFIIEALLEKAQKEDKIAALPKSPALRATTLGEIYPQDLTLQKALSFYAFLKTVLKTNYERREEFRRHVTLVVSFPNSTAEIDIDNLVNCERFVHKFFNYACTQIMGRSEDDD